jgi:hypothetical protein
MAQNYGVKVMLVRILPFLVGLWKMLCSRSGHGMTAPTKSNSPARSRKMSFLEGPEDCRILALASVYED